MDAENKWENIINCKIRLAAPEDTESIWELDKICFTVPWSYNDFENELNNNALALYVVAENNEKIIGYAGVWCIVDEGHITNVGVHPSYRKSGIGKKLIAALMDEARKKAGTRSFTLEVRVSNKPAIGLYEGFGFKEVGKRKGYYSDTKEDAAIMWWVESED